jgi:hypothetical protein
MEIMETSSPIHQNIQKIRSFKRKACSKTRPTNDLRKNCGIISRPGKLSVKSRGKLSKGNLNCKYCSKLVLGPHTLKCHEVLCSKNPTGQTSLGSVQKEKLSKKDFNCKYCLKTLAQPYTLKCHEVFCSRNPASQKCTGKMVTRTSDDAGNTSIQVDGAGRPNPSHAKLTGTSPYTSTQISTTLNEPAKILPYQMNVLGSIWSERISRGEYKDVPMEFLLMQYFHTQLLSKFGIRY